MPELAKKPSAFQRFTNRLFDPGPNVSERSLAQNNQLADALFVAGSQSAPLRSPAQGFAQLAQALNSQILRKQGERGQEALKSQEAKQLGNVLANLSLEPDAEDLIRNLPKDLQGDALGQLVGQKFAVPEPQTPRDAVNFGNSSGEVQLSAVPGTPEFNAAVQDPNLLRIGPVSQVQRQETAGPGGFDAKSVNTDAVESANVSAALRRNLTATLPEIEENKGSVGFRGQAGLGVGGFVTNILGEQAGNEVANAIAGNDQEKIAQVLTRMQTLRSALIPILTGERSSRFSEPERDIANKAVGIIDQIKGPGDLARSFPQVQGALKELTVATLENEFEQAAISPSVQFPFDLSNDQGFIELGKMLSDAGFTLEEAIRARDRLIRIQNQ